MKAMSFVIRKCVWMPLRAISFRRQIAPETPAPCRHTRLSKSKLLVSSERQRLLGTGPEGADDFAGYCHGARSHLNLRMTLYGRGSFGTSEKIAIMVGRQPGGWFPGGCRRDICKFAHVMECTASKALALCGVCLSAACPPDLDYAPMLALKIMTSSVLMQRSPPLSFSMMHCGLFRLGS